MVIVCAFDRLKLRFGCLRRDMDINVDDLTYVIHSCLILHNFCEIHKEPVNSQYVTAALKYGSEFHPSKKQPPVVFCKKSVPKNFATLLKKRLWHMCFPVNFAKFLRTSFLQNTSGRLLLNAKRV